MYTQSPFVFRFGNSRVTVGGAASWLLLAPGIGLTLLAVAILIWPELLAYLVAGALLMGGLALTSWGWAIQRAARRQPRATRYEVYPGESI